MYAQILSVQLLLASSLASAATAARSWRYLGCVDSNSLRVDHLHSATVAHVTVETCQESCKGFDYLAIRADSCLCAGNPSNADVVNEKDCAALDGSMVPWYTSVSPKAPRFVNVPREEPSCDPCDTPIVAAPTTCEDGSDYGPPTEQPGIPIPEPDPMPKPEPQPQPEPAPAPLPEPAPTEEFPGPSDEAVSQPSPYETTLSTVTKQAPGGEDCTTTEPDEKPESPSTVVVIPSEHDSGDEGEPSAPPPEPTVIEPSGSNGGGVDEPPAPTGPGESESGGDEEEPPAETGGDEGEEPTPTGEEPPANTSAGQHIASSQLIMSLALLAGSLVFSVL